VPLYHLLQQFEPNGQKAKEKLQNINTSTIGSSIPLPLSHAQTFRNVIPAVSTQTTGLTVLNLTFKIY